MGKKVLVVDDEDDVRLFLEDFLVDRDLDVRTASNGEEALKKISEDKPEIVLLDIMMPGMDGLQCLELIKNDHSEINVIMITALKDDDRIERAEQLGASNYIIKPFSLKYLETELMKFIN